MPRRILAVTVLLAVLVACRDGPADLSTPASVTTAPTDGLRSLGRFMDDPFIRGLVEEVHGVEVADRVDLTLKALRFTTTEAERRRAFAALTNLTRAMRTTALDQKDVIVQATLRLVVDEALPRLGLEGQSPRSRLHPDQDERRRHEP